jgi:cytochrome c peroxidase
MRTRTALGAAAGLLLALAAGAAALDARPWSPDPSFAAVQFEPAPGGVDANREGLAALVADAAGRGARYVALPELALTGPGAPAAEPVPGPATRWFGELARRHGVWIALSLLEAGEGGTFLATVLIDDRGEIASRYRKILTRHAQDGPVARGSYRDIVETVDDGGMRIGILAGDDAVTGIPRLAERGAETILVTAAWADGDQEDWEALCRRLAREHRVHLVVANRRGAQARERAWRLGGIYTREGGAWLSAAGAAPQVVVQPLPRRPARWPLRAPLGLPSVPVPTSQDLSPEMVELGRRLFTDRSLSSTGTVACASCHQPDRAFADGRVKGVGVHDRTTKRNVPSLLNVAYRPLLQWDGYASTLENFVKYPVSAINEMDFHYLDRVQPYVRAHADYPGMFRGTMGVDSAEFDHVARALGAYLRTLNSGNSAFDRYAYGGERDALTPQQLRGLAVFNGKGRCTSCHTIGERNALFMDNRYHDLGVGWDTAGGGYRDIGLGAISTNAGAGRFLTPSLRNVALTAPYMHDGSLATLEEVIDYLDRGGNPSPHRDVELRPLGLTPGEKRDVVAFLHALTGDQAFDASGNRTAP